MSCNAVAMATAAVDIDEAIRKLIPADLLKKGIVAFLKSKYSGVNLWESTYSKNFAVYFSKDGCPMKIDYDERSGGFVVLSDGYSGTAAVESVRKEIDGVIKVMAAAAIGGKAKSAVQKLGGKITGENVAPNGGRMINFEL